jgi:hypothetical protein
MRVISQDSTRVLGAYVCPDGFVSQVVYFSQKPDLHWFNGLISSQVGADNFATSDVRVASRHGWELGGDAQEILRAKLGPNASLIEVYWTRYARTDVEKRIAVSLCMGDGSRSGCLSLFAHESRRIEKFCSTCRKGRSG